MEVVLYTMNKRNKSSARPSGEGLVLNLQLKDECDLEHPEFIFEFEPTAYNYCYIPSWNRYYFKGEQQYFHGRWFVKFDEDYLATWVTDIRNTRAYVMYDNNTYDIVDKRIPTIATPVIDYADGEFRDDIPSPPLAAQGTYIICSVGGDGVQVNATRSAANLRTLLTDLNNWLLTLGNSITDPTTGFKSLVTQLLGTNDVTKNLRSVVFIPILVDNTVPLETLKLGLYDTGIHFPKIDLDDIYVKKSGEVNIPWQVNDWRRNAPYSEVYLYIPYVGMINYPSSDLVDRTKFEVESVINIVTGDMSVLVRAVGASDTIVMGTYGANVAANIPIGSAGLSPVNLATQVVKGGLMAAGVASGIAIPTEAALMAGGASMVMEGLEPMATTIGNLGGGTANKLSNRLACFTSYRNTIVEPSSVVDIIGAPSMFVKSLANASGFIQTAGFQLGGIATAPEKDAVNALMDSGAYLE